MKTEDRSQRTGIAKLPRPPRDLMDDSDRGLGLISRPPDERSDRKIQEELAWLLLGEDEPSGLPPDPDEPPPLPPPPPQSGDEEFKGRQLGATPDKR
jgi:hypothetical protein